VHGDELIVTTTSPYKQAAFQKTITSAAVLLFAFGAQNLKY
jgi:hypothetical protein